MTAARSDDGEMRNPAEESTRKDTVFQPNPPGGSKPPGGS